MQSTWEENILVEKENLQLTIGKHTPYFKYVDEF